MVYEQKNGNFKQILLSNWVSVHLMEVSVSISVSKLIAEYYQYQYRYRNLITEKYHYRINIEYSDLHSISIVSVSKKVVSNTSVLHGLYFSSILSVVIIFQIKMFFFSKTRRIGPSGLPCSLRLPRGF